MFHELLIVPYTAELWRQIEVWLCRNINKAIEYGMEVNQKRKVLIKDKVIDVGNNYV